MAENRGKRFEGVIKEAFEKVQGVSIDRLHDQTTGYAGSSNICDYIVYREPYEYYFECKSVHGNTLSIHSNDEKHKYGNITNKQWEGLLEKAKIQGVFAGIICWWADKDITLFIPIQLLQWLREREYKSVRYNCDWNVGIPNEKPFTFKTIYRCIEIKGKKKRVFYDYDMEGFLNELSTTGNTKRTN